MLMCSRCLLGSPTPVGVSSFGGFSKALRYIICDIPVNGPRMVVIPLEEDFLVRRGGGWVWLMYHHEQWRRRSTRRNPNCVEVASLINNNDEWNFRRGELCGVYFFHKTKNIFLILWNLYWRKILINVSKNNYLFIIL